MVAYSFRAQFRAPVLDGIKQQTIRADRKRHARPGEEVQLYTGMRTRQCAIIGRAKCVTVHAVRLWVEAGAVEIDGRAMPIGRLDEFARDDGFDDWPAMQAFWRKQHPDTPVFSGVMIRWGTLLPLAVVDVPDEVG